MKALPCAAPTPRALTEWVPGHAVGSSHWWAAVRRRGTPLRGQVDGDVVELLFLWRARHRVSPLDGPQGSPEGQPVSTVYVEVDGHTPHPSAGAVAMHHLEGSDVWHWSTRLPVDWLGSYAFLPAPPGHPPMPDSAGERRAWWQALVHAVASADPHSELPPTADGWGRPRGLLSPAIAPRPSAAARGRTVSWTWDSAGLARPRRVWLHLTPGAGPRQWLLLLDGQAWALHLGWWPELDSAVVDAELTPLAVLAVDACHPDLRWREFGCHAPFWQAVQDELLPEAARRVGVARIDRCGRCRAKPGRVGGAVRDLALAAPLSRGLEQSGYFWWPDPAGGASSAQLVRQVSEGSTAGLPVRAVLQSGRRDPEDMRALSAAMAAALGPERAVLHEIAGGHDWACWRAALIPGLKALLTSSIPSP